MKTARKKNVEVTAEDLFKANGPLARKFNAILKGFALSHKMNRSLSVKFKEGDFVGYTDGAATVLNPFNEFFTKPEVSLDMQAEYVLGVAAHELAHCIYTGFEEVRVEQEGIENGKILSRPTLSGKDEDNMQEIEEFIKTTDGSSVILQVFHDLHNVLEDGFIEVHFLDEFDSILSDALIAVRLHQFYDATPVDDIIAQGVQSKWAFTTSMMLSYAKYGMYLHRDEEILDSEEFESISRVYDIIDNYVEGPTGHQTEKIAMIWTIMAKEWDLLKPEAEQAASSMQAMREFAEALKNAKPMQAGESDGEAKGTPIKIFVPGGSGDKEEGESSEGENSEGSSSVTGDEKEENSKENSGEKSKSSENGSERSSSETEGKKKKSEAEGEAENDGDGEDSESSKRRKAAKKTKARNDKSEGKIQKTTAEEGGRIDNVGVEGEVDNSSREGETTRDIIEAQTELVDISSIINDLRREKATKEAEADTTRQKKLEASEMRLKGAIHKGVAFHLNRIGEVTEALVNGYEQDSPELLSISKRAQKALSKKLKNRENSIKTMGLTGKRLEVGRLHRTDMSYFSTKTTPHKMPPLAVCVLIDESGSMSAYNRAAIAKASAIIIEDLCRGLNLPCAIYGHWTSSKRVEIDEFKSFDDIDKKDKYRLECITAKGANRDGAALYYVGEQLKKRPEQNKLMIVISDGQPADTDYYGEAADKDTHDAKQRLTKAGIKVFAAAIGADKENIERIYGDGFMDITNLDALPEILTKLVVKNIR